MEWTTEQRLDGRIVGSTLSSVLMTDHAIECAPVMSWTSQNREFARKLGTISGDPFQEAMVCLLQRSIIDFQRISTRPSGDGGLDGLSHEWTRAYCCYGLDLQPSAKTTTDELRDKVVNKFKEDLRKLCELKHTGPTLIHADNSRLAGILTAGKKLRHIQLISNYIEDNRIVGDLSAAFMNYRSASKCIYIDKSCTMSIWGPHDICNNMTIDDAAMLSVENPALATVIDEVENTAPHDLPAIHPSKSTLDDKIAVLSGDQQDYKDLLLQDWGRYILFMQKLDATLPNLHRDIEKLVRRVSVKANLESNTAKHGSVPTELISKIEAAIEEGTKGILSKYVSSTDIDAFKERTVARLIGMCPIDWRPSKK